MDFEKYLSKMEEKIVRSAETKEAARELYDVKEKFKEVGFTEREAFDLLLATIKMSSK